MLHQDDCEFYAWKTLFDSEFDDEQFLYHYTSFENACKILYNESLRFSPLARSNDTAESKPKIMITNNEDKEKMKLLVSRFEKINKQKIKLLNEYHNPKLAKYLSSKYVSAFKVIVTDDNIIKGKQKK